MAIGQVEEQIAQAMVDDLKDRAKQHGVKVFQDVAPRSRDLGDSDLAGATVGGYGNKTRYPEPKAGWDFAKIAAAAAARLDASNANLVQHAARKSRAALSAEVAVRVAVACGLPSYQNDVRAVESHADRVEVRLGSPVVDEAMAVRLLTAVGLITGRLKGGVVLTLSADEARVVRQCLEFGMDALPADDRTLASAAFDQLVKAGA